MNEHPSQPSQEREQSQGIQRKGVDPSTEDLSQSDFAKSKQQPNLAQKGQPNQDKE